MKKKKQSKRDKATEKLEMLMQDLETEVDPNSTGAWSCRRIYCI